MIDPAQFFDILKKEFGVDTVSQNFDVEYTRLQQLIPEKTLLDIAKKLSGWEIETASKISADPNLKATFGIESLQTHRFLPLYQEGSTLGIVIDNPFSTSLSFLKSRYKTLDIRLLPQNELSKILLFAPTQMMTPFTSLIQEALIAQASDLHITHTPNNVQLSYRRFGKLIPVTLLSHSDWKPISASLKLHARMDISLIHFPQDGQLRFETETHTYDIRISTLPTSHGDDMVLRFFHQKPASASFESLGFLPKIEEKIQTWLNQKSGLILVTGATGSGKTTTLYTALNYLLSQKNRMIITLEDPIETQLPGIRQSQVNSASGYTFQAGLRAILRQDPDVIMIGEIRDAETAKIALEAAYTGHLVLSTLHTADCKSTLLRLNNLGLDPFWIHYSLKGIISQTLVPKRCTQCKNTKTGCQHCQFTQEDGLIALTELLEPSSQANHTSPFLSEINTQFYHSWQDDLHKKQQLGWVP